MEKNSSESMIVVITGAAGQISYSLYNLIGNGLVFGNQQKISLRLLDIEPCLKILEGVRLELEDCAYELFTDIQIGSDPEVIFKDADLVIFLGGYPRKPGMERKVQGDALNKVAKKTCKSLVVANPANTNCLTLADQCTTIPKKNFTCLTRLDQNRCYAQIANRIGKPVQSLKNIILWGNHSATQFPDVKFATIDDKQKVTDIVEQEYLQNEFISVIQKRGAEIIQARGASSVMSAANAIKDHLKTWYNGTPEGQYTSMGVYTENFQNLYGIPDNMVFSFPVICKNFDWEVVKGLELDEFQKSRIQITLKELQEEKSDSQNN